MEDLKIENARLQKMVDILDSQPDLVFCTNIDGQITYISDRAKSLIKIDESLDVDPSHMSQILASESLDVFLDALNQVKQSSVYSTRNSQTCAPISAVRVCT
jgi:PAS domain-containing protein